MNQPPGVTPSARPFDSARFLDGLFRFAAVGVMAACVVLAAATANYLMENPRSVDGGIVGLLAIALGGCQYTALTRCNSTAASLSAMLLFLGAIGIGLYLFLLLLLSLSFALDPFTIMLCFFLLGSLLAIAGAIGLNMRQARRTSAPETTATFRFSLQDLFVALSAVAAVLGLAGMIRPWLR